MEGREQVATSAEVSRNFGKWQDFALRGPVHVSHHGRARVVLVSADDYSRMAREAPVAAPRDSSAELALRAVLSGMREGFVALDSQLRVRALNPVAEVFLGRTEAQMVGALFYPPESADRMAVVVERLRWVIRSGETVKFEAQGHRNPDRRLMVQAFPLRDGVGMLFSNISELTALRAESALWRAERGALADHQGVCAASLNVLGFFETANAGMLAFLGFSEAQLHDVRLGDLATADGRSELAAGVNRLIRREQDGYAADIEFLTRENGRRTLSLAIRPRFRDETCEGFAVVGLAAAGSEDCPHDLGG